ncbi:MAG: hypothetical protein KAQ87_01395 [Candidatus Pacebacteria bacterium]|nr:hypothetical protein [Candidatus Paceibacterota bacterium]
MNNDIVKLCEDACKSEIKFSYDKLNGILEECDSTNKLLERLDEEKEATEKEESYAGAEEYDEYGNEVNEYGETLDSEKAIEREQGRTNNLENDYYANLPSDEKMLLSDISKNESFYEDINKSFPESKEFINNISKYGIKEEELGYLVGKIKGFESALNLLSNFKDDEYDEELEEYKGFIKDITPLMEKLEGKDEIVHAILDDKITVELAKNLLDNKQFQNTENEAINEEDQISEDCQSVTMYEDGIEIGEYSGKVLDSDDAIEEERELEKEHRIEMEELEEQDDIENELDENLEYKNTINADDEEISNSETFPTEQSYKQIYDAYINSNTWTEKKAEIENTYKLNDWNIECVRCGSKYNLQVHHNYYIGNKYFGYENISDTDYLCAKCHREWHEIQKSSSLSQNRSLEEYYHFIIADETRVNQINHLLIKKIKIDALEIESYFLRTDVIEYNKISARLNWIFLISVILLFVYGIGIIVMIIASFIKNEKPENFDLYKQKRDSLESKKRYLELRKYHNIIKEDV